MDFVRTEFWREKPQEDTGYTRKEELNMLTRNVLLGVAMGLVVSVNARAVTYELSITRMGCPRNDTNPTSATTH